MGFRKELLAEAMGLVSAEEEQICGGLMGGGGSVFTSMKTEFMVPAFQSPTSGGLSHQVETAFDGMIGSLASLFADRMVHVSQDYASCPEDV